MSFPLVTSLPPQSTTVTASTPDETANWKTYLNSSLGFSFKYPLNVYDNRQKQSLRVFARSRSYDFNLDNGDLDKDFEITEFTIAGQSTIEVEIKGRDVQDQKHLFIEAPLKDKVIIIY